MSAEEPRAKGSAGATHGPSAAAPRKSPAPSNPARPRGRRRSRRIIARGLGPDPLHLLSTRLVARGERLGSNCGVGILASPEPDTRVDRSEEHTSELQSQSNLVCRLLLA